MNKENAQVEQFVPVRLIRLRARAQGIAAGTVAALIIFVATNWLVIKGGSRVGPHLALLAQFFIGYRVSFFGSFIGAAYAFVTGYALGYVVAFTYNLFAGRRETTTIHS